MNKPADYVENYNSIFKDFLENPDGTLDKDKVMRELADYSWLLDSVAKVYCAITHGRISKQNTLPDVVISVYEDCVTETVNDALEEAKENCTCDAYC